jgi:hypothetical protein
MTNQSSHEHRASVKSKKPTKVNLQGTEMASVLLRRNGRDEFYHLPICGVCGLPIVNFEESNVVVVGSEIGESHESLEPLGRIGGAEFFRLPGTAIAVHFECDQGWMPWVRASSIFCKDQGGPIEKLGWTVGS